MSRGDFTGYLRAAKRKHADPEAIIGTAAAELTAKQLAQLVSVLTDRHGYRLPKARRDPLIDALLAEGLGPSRIARLLGCGRNTVARVGNRDNRGSETAYPSGADAPESAPAGSRSDLPVLSTSYGDGRLIRRLLDGDPGAFGAWRARGAGL